MADKEDDENRAMNKRAHEVLQIFLEQSEHGDDIIAEIVKRTLAQIVQRYGVKIIDLSIKGDGTCTLNDLYRIQCEVMRECEHDLKLCIRQTTSLNHKVLN